MDISIIKMPGGIGRWNLVAEYLRLRSKVFIDDIGWDLVAQQQFEYEQYDALSNAVYIIAHKHNTVIAGARLIRCDTKVGSGSTGYTYMINDAFHERIDLPKAICWEQPPLDTRSWELSRLIATQSQGLVAKQILDATNAYIKSVGGTRCLFLGWYAFMRMARSYGYSPRQMGDVIKDGKRSYVAFECPVI